MRPFIPYESQTFVLETPSVQELNLKRKFRIDSPHKKHIVLCSNAGYGEIEKLLISHCGVRKLAPAFNTASGFATHDVIYLPRRVDVDYFVFLPAESHAQGNRLPRLSCYGRSCFAMYQYGYLWLPMNTKITFL